MLQRQTQTAIFWQEQFEVTPDDLEFIYNLLLDTQTSHALSELATLLIQEYIRKESAKIDSELSKGAVYQPESSYQVDQKLVFPILDFAVGTVQEIREGHNPEHGTFSVMQILFNELDETREFAADLKTHHVLNQVNGHGALGEEGLLSPQEIYELYKSDINDSILYSLEESDRSSDFVEVGGQWLLADMLSEIHIGHLNIAEAMIDLGGKPLTPAEVLAELDLESGSSEAMTLLSMNHGLENDERFDMVGTEAQPLWYLRRLEPIEAIEVPILLRPTQPTYNRSLLSVELLQIEWELDDEWGESSLSSELPSIVPSTTLTLTYPHRRCGTIPLNGRTRSFFPLKDKGRSAVTLIDGRWGTHMQGWVVHEGRYVTGLAKWMEEHGLPVGAQVTLERTSNPNEIVVDYRTRRAKREWTRMATANLESMKLNFEMNKIQITCEYDEDLTVSESDPGPIGQLRILLNQNRVELTRIVEDLMPELTKLSTQSTIHVKTVYSAANMLRRSAPGPVFYALISNRKFRDLGNGYFGMA
ncbi:MAG: hypothetical protein AAF702_03880 [Chloroflexota bacterium]